MAILVSNSSHRPQLISTSLIWPTPMCSIKMVATVWMDLKVLWESSISKEASCGLKRSRVDICSQHINQGYLTDIFHGCWGELILCKSCSYSIRNTFVISLFKC